MRHRPYRKPQVLLLGNGIIRAYSNLAMSWKDMLRRIGTDKDIPDEIAVPMPLEIVVRTGDHVDLVLRDHKEELYGTVETEEFRDVLRHLLSMGFDHILTTNYSYELEEAAIGKSSLSDSELDRLEWHTNMVSENEKKFQLFTYNYVECGGHPNTIWHIHGEAKKPDSIVLGHLYYGNLLSCCRDYLVNTAPPRFAMRRGRKILSWVDAFMLGDVYTIGFGYDFSEMDLWWLLNCKKMVPPQTGGTLYYYRPGKPKPFDVKSALMHDYGAQLVSFGDIEPVQDRTEYYRGFYQRAIADIEKRIQDSGEQG